MTPSGTGRLTDREHEMIIQIALGILLAYVLIVTMKYWLPFLVWIALGLIGLVFFMVVAA